MLGLMKANGFVDLPNILHINLQQCHNLCQWIDKSPFNPLDIKCNLMWKTSENLNVKNLWKRIFRPSRRVNVLYLVNMKW